MPPTPPPRDRRRPQRRSPVGRNGGRNRGGTIVAGAPRDRRRGPAERRPGVQRAGSAPRSAARGAPGQRPRWGAGPAGADREGRRQRVGRAGEGRGAPGGREGIGFVIGPYNSSVGLQNLSLYRQNRVLPLWMTSSDETKGAGATVQPMNSQIAPIEQRYLSSLPARRVTMLVDDTPNGAFTKGMARRLRTALEKADTTVNWIPVVEGAERVLRGQDRRGARDDAGPRLREHLLPGGRSDRQRRSPQRGPRRRA